MKKTILTLIACVAFSSSAFANISFTYLGGTGNNLTCRRLAGTYRYQYYSYGPGWDHRGIYYPYWNSCFGGMGNPNIDIPNPQLTTHYDVYVKDGQDIKRCSEDIEWEIQNVRCRLSSKSDYLQCTARQGDMKSLIERVRCVDRAYRVDR